MFGANLGEPRCFQIARQTPGFQPEASLIFCSLKNGWCRADTANMPSVVQRKIRHDFLIGMVLAQNEIPRFEAGLQTTRKSRGNEQGRYAVI